MTAWSVGSFASRCVCSSASVGAGNSRGDLIEQRPIGAREIRVRRAPTTSLSARPSRWRLALFGTLRALALRASCASWRTKTRGLDALDRMLASDAPPPIAVFWHTAYVALMPLLRGRNVCVFTSLSARGDAIADLLTRFGYRPVQLADAGGQASLAQMRDALAAGYAGAIAVDGPLGPRHSVHRGAIELAAALGRPLLPIALAMHPKRVATARWDRLELPRLFARVRLVAGQPIAVPVLASRRDVAHWERLVHCALDDVETEANAWLNEDARRSPRRYPDV